MIDRVRVHSEQSESVTYVITFVGNEPVACTCPHFHFRATEDGEFECKHMRKARQTPSFTQADVVRLRSILGRI